MDNITITLKKYLLLFFNLLIENVHLTKHSLYNMPTDNEQYY
jgi:hypothetical protein